VSCPARRWVTEVDRLLVIDVVVRPLLFTGLSALAIAPLERLLPAHAPRTRGWAIDLAFATAGQVVVRFALVIGLGSLFAALDVYALDAAALAVGPAWLTRGLHVLLGVLLFELGGYVYHRLAHTLPWLWRLHAVHHSSETMDWLASFRQHPLEIVLMTLVQNAPLVLLGIPLGSHALVLVLLKLNTVFVHANLRVHAGRLGHLVATPAFHHRHHARSGPTRNFAGLFPWLDRVFGTFSAEPAHAFGVAANVCERTGPVDRGVKRLTDSAVSDRPARGLGS
jgi:sterol desaturase/sphingolipid hydroxylase (fatty acid hydroxylase superfamily)